MSLNLSKQYTFSPNTTIASAQVNADYDDLYNALSGLEALTKSFAKLKVDIDPSTALEVATKQYVDHYSAYRRPVLASTGLSTVDVENNTGTANQTSIIFPDGTLISVTEDTSVANKYRRFDITATANFTSGTEDSGLRSGLSEAVNTWYAIYAVKSQINTSNFVLAGDTTLPLQANYATLNTRYATNSWVYLGMIRNGNGQAASSDILSFTQSGDTTIFKNAITPTSATSEVSTGIQLADLAAATAASLAWTASLGTGAAQIPDHCKFGYFNAAWAAIANTNLFATNDGNTFSYLRQNNTNGSPTLITTIGPVTSSNGFRLASTNNTAMNIMLGAYTDSVLGVGPNPQL